MHLLHKWHTVRVEHYVRNSVFAKQPDRADTGYPFTKLYQRCLECRNMRTYDIEGHWSMEELDT